MDGYEKTAICFDSKDWPLKVDYHRVNLIDRIPQSLREKPVRVLEFGAGMGTVIALIHAAFDVKEYVCVDNCKGVLDSLPDYVKKVHAESIDAVSKETAGLFDIIVAADVWEHLGTMETVVKYTQFCIEKLSEGGVLILSVPNIACPMMPFVFNHDITHRIRFNEATVRQMFLAAEGRAGALEIYPRKTPHIGYVRWLGKIRDAVISATGVVMRLGFALYGLPSVKIFTADLIVVYRA